MKKKLIKIAKKTNADNKQIAKLSKLGLFSALFFMIAGLVACSSTPSKSPAAPAPDKDASKTAASPKPAGQITDDEDGEMPVIRPKRPAGGSGPWEGYPAGTKYATVSTSDFK